MKYNVFYTRLCYGVATVEADSSFEADAAAEALYNKWASGENEWAIDWFEDELESYHLEEVPELKDYKLSLSEKQAEYLINEIEGRIPELIGNLNNCEPNEREYWITLKTAMTALRKSITEEQE